MTKMHPSTVAHGEAPAEGAGDGYPEDRMSEGMPVCGECGGWGDHLSTCARGGFRARSSAPEAREEALGNLLAVIHGDGGHRALEVGVEQAAAEAEQIVARLLSSAPEAREGEVVGQVNALKSEDMADV